MTTGLTVVLGLGLAPSLAQDGPSFRFENLVQILDKKPKTIEALLKELPPEYRNRFTLAYESKSLQRATPSDPRAVLFGDGQLFLTFVGSTYPSDGGNRVEILHFDNTGNRYEMREILQTPKGLHLSDANPAKCLECHGNPPHPIWEDYFRWPGFYGSVDDFPKGRPNTFPGPPENEEKNFRYFWDNIKSTHPRYQHLGNRFFSDDRTIRPNTEITRFFRILTMRSAVQLYSEKSGGKKSIVRLAAWLASSQGVCTPQNMGLIRPPIDGAALNSSRDFLFEIAKAAPPHFLASKKEGLDISARSLDTLYLYDGTNNQLLDLYETFQAVLQNAPVNFLSEASQKQLPFYRVVDCKELEGQIRTYFGTASPNACPTDDQVSLPSIKKVVDALQRGPNLSKICASCHSDPKTQAPSIPFGDEAILAKWLKEKPDRLTNVLSRIAVDVSPKKRMPPNKPLEENDAIFLRQYFEMLQSTK